MPCFGAYISTLYNNLSLFVCFAASILPMLTFVCLYIDDFLVLAAIAGFLFKALNFVAWLFFNTSKLFEAI